MRRLALLTSALCAALLFPLSCGTPNGGPTADGTSAALAAPAPTAAELVPAPHAPRLALRAFALATRGQAPEARRLLASELAGRLASGTPGDDAARDDAVVAALGWRELVHQRERWSEGAAWTERVLAGAGADPFATSADPELVAQLLALRAECLQHAGRVDEARAIARALGHVTDWRILGPFDNERGKGFAKKEKPESELDLAATYTGKARAVAWRANPVADHPRGVLDLGALLRPSTQGFAYLATAVESPAAQEVVLRTSSRGPLKVFVNGREVLAKKAVRPVTFDQDRVVVALQPGWNRLLVKSCIEEQDDWIVTARCTALDGRPLALATDSARAADAPPEAAKAKEKAVLETRERLDARAKTDPDAARLLALYHHLAHPDERTTKSAQKAAALALAAAPDDADTVYLAARVAAPDADTSREELEVNPWIAPLKRVVELDPTHVAARLDLAGFALDLNPTLARADTLSAEAERLAPDDPDVLQLRERVLGALGRDGEAAVLEEREKVLAESAWTRSGAATRARDLVARGAPDAALALLARAADLDRQYGASTDERIALLAGRGDLDAIERICDEALAAAPFAYHVALEAARRLERGGATDRARAFLERARRLAPEDVDVLRALAKLEQRAGHAEASDALVAEILRIDPNQDVLRRQREFLAKSSEERFEAPFVWDARAVLAAAPAPDQDEPLCLLDRTAVYRVNRDGTSSSYEHLLWRVQNDGGAKALSVYGVFYPSGGSLVVRNLRVLHADGTADPVPAPRRGDQQAGSGVVRVYELPPLRVGDALDVEYRVEDSVPSVFGNYFGRRHDFYPGRPDPLAPTLRSELVYVTAPDVQLWFHARNGAGLETSETKDARGNTVRRWVATNLARPKPESAMPDKVEFAPLVDASTYENWQAFATWWWSFIEKEFESSPAMKEKVRELTQGLATDRDRIQALVRFVGQEIRYNMWPFGTHGYEPYSAPTIFERRFGDCKDKSILLCTMLAEIGVHAHPVLIHARYLQPDEPLDAALVEHFNHCIAYVPASGERPGMYLDCTADLNPIDYLRVDDQGARVLHVDGGKGSLHDIPFAPPAENQMVRKYDVRLDAKGDGDVALTDESNGAFGVGLRTNYGGEKGDIAKRLERDLRESFSQVDVREVKTSELEDLGLPARLEARFGAKKLWAAEGSGASLRLAFDGLGLGGLAVEPRDARQRELVLDRPFAHDVAITYRLPEGARALDLPAPVEVAVPGLVTYRQSVAPVEGGVEVRRRFELLVRRIGVADYARFQDAVRAIELAEQRTLRIETQPAGGR
ncbi:MAG: DUF3857 domain-containing protein [Planctomycetes bacterium]|nr:DUF3857 domain-containing protein [Planctomycetota bacterium]